MSDDAHCCTSPLMPEASSVSINWLAGSGRRERNGGSYGARTNPAYSIRRSATASGGGEVPPNSEW
jgi:hypothetical protein